MSKSSSILHCYGVFWLGTTPIKDFLSSSDKLAWTACQLVYTHTTKTCGVLHNRVAMRGLIFKIEICGSRRGYGIHWYGYVMGGTWWWDGMGWLWWMKLVHRMRLIELQIQYSIAWSARVPVGNLNSFSSFIMLICPYCSAFLDKKSPTPSHSLHPHNPKTQRETIPRGR